MDDRRMAYGNVITDVRRIFFESTMYDRPILDIHAVPNSNIVDIAANDSVEPYAAFIAHHHVADNRCVWSDKAVSTKLRMFIQTRKDRCHNSIPDLIQSSNFVQYSHMSNN